MTDILTEICNVKKEHVANLKQDMSLQSLQEKMGYVPKPRGFMKALQGKATQQEYGLIAEIKKASPSHGLIRADFNPEELAQAYEAGGASCLSILTDTPYFQGENDYLIQARAACTLPVLRKDFMVDPYQVFEARHIGADCILIIMAALSNEQARELEEVAHDLEMDVLIEVHDEAECERALTHMSSKLLGVNNRNLKTLEIDTQISLRIKDMIPADYLAVSESGLKTNDDLKMMADAGIYSFLIGESLMRQDDLTTATQQILGQAA